MTREQQTPETMTVTHHLTPARAEVPGRFGPYRCLRTEAGTPVFDTGTMRQLCADDAARFRFWGGTVDRLTMRPDAVVEWQHIYRVHPDHRRPYMACDVVEYVADSLGRYLLWGAYPGPWEITGHDPGDPLPPSRAEQAEAAIAPALALQARARAYQDEWLDYNARANEAQRKARALERQAEPMLLRAAELNPHRYGHHAPRRR